VQKEIFLNERWESYEKLKVGMEKIVRIAFMRI
jgi:hypothetical protein